MIDKLDARLIGLLAAEPRVGVLEASRRLGVARGTVQARLDRLQARGVVTGYGPDIDPAALDHAVTAFVTLEIRQAGGHDPVAERLAAVPEVLEVHTITGAGDMLCRVVARTNADLQRVIDAIVGTAGVVRAFNGDRAGHSGALQGAAAGAHRRPADPTTTRMWWLAATPITPPSPPRPAPDHRGGSQQREAWSARLLQSS